MDVGTINNTIKELKELGVFWVGLTGGEPLLNKHLEAIVEKIGEECAVKLFTTGRMALVEEGIENKEQLRTLLRGVEKTS